jgi:transcriptional accessory protein Tex/SPT6
MDHKKDDVAIDIANGTVTSSSRNVKPKITTQGWQLLMLWKDKLTSWVNLKDLKASNPIELAEYAVVNQIVEEPAFKWWVSNTLRKHNHIISKVKKKYWQMMHKFGFKLPHSVEEALEIDRQTGTDHWQRALNKEMSKVKVAWNAHDDITLNDI